MPPPDSSKTRLLGLALGGAGVAAIGVGIAYGAIAVSRRHEANAACPDQCPDQGGVDLWNRARSAGNLSTGAFVIGAVAIASGVVLWLRGRRAADGALAPRQVGLGPGGLQVKGSW